MIDIHHAHDWPTGDHLPVSHSRSMRKKAMGHQRGERTHGPCTHIANMSIYCKYTLVRFRHEQLRMDDLLHSEDDTVLDAQSDGRSVERYPISEK